MSNLLNYLEFITESVNDGKIIYSVKFRTLLKSVSDKAAKDERTKMFNIASHLLMIENRSDYKDTFTLIDITDKNDTLSMINVSRINRAISNDPDILSFIDSIPQELRVDHIISHASYGSNNVNWINKLWNSQRTDVKVGRYAKRVLTNVAKLSVNDTDVEMFVNLYKSSFDYEKGMKDKIEIVSGDAIREWYSEETYQSGGGSLNNSCMRYPKCQRYFDIYVKNPEVCQMMILKNEDGKLIGRALIWKLDNGKTYMDRVYTVNDSDTNIFKEYAEEKGWTNTYYTRNSSMTVQLKKEEYNKFPYMDTFHSYNKETNVLVNDEVRESDEWYILQNTDGSYSEGGGVWSEYHGEYISAEEAIWCENIDSYVHQDEAIWLEYRQEWAGPSDGIVWSEYQQESYYRDDASFSDCMGSWLYNEEMITVITNASGDTDYCLPDRKDLYIESDNGEYYLRKNYVKNPFGEGYVFLDQKIDGVKFIDMLESKVKEETGDTNDGKKAREKLRSIVDELISKMDNGDLDDIINQVADSESYKKLGNWWRMFMSKEPLLSPKLVLYYILYWSICETHFDPNKYSYGFNGTSTQVNAYNGVLDLIKNEEDKLVYKNCVIRQGSTNDNPNASNERIRSFVCELTNIAIQFDYSVFGNEFLRLYLYLTT